MENACYAGLIVHFTKIRRIPASSMAVLESNHSVSGTTCDAQLSRVMRSAVKIGNCVIVISLSRAPQQSPPSPTPHHLNTCVAMTSIPASTPAPAR